MIERCPNCGARSEGSATCRRCAMDLSSLIRVEAAAERLIQGALASIAAIQPPPPTENRTLGRVLGRPEVMQALLGSAKQDLTAAAGLHATPFTQLLLGFAEELQSADHRPRPQASEETIPPDEDHSAQTDRTDSGPLG
jgi:hypothetical protein